MDKNAEDDDQVAGKKIYIVDKRLNREKMVFNTE